MGNTSKQRSIKKRRRLQELYARGREVRFTADSVQDGPFEESLGEDAEAVAMWICPPSPLQREQALRDAQAARQRALLRARKDEDSLESAAARSFIAGLSDDQLHEYLLSLDQADRFQEAQRVVLKDDEWSDFTELQDAMRQWEEAGKPEGDEWTPLLERDTEFGKQVAAESDRLRDSALESLKAVPRPEKEKRAFDKRIELEASSAFMEHYEWAMMFYGCRDDEDHNELFFEDIDEMRSQDERIQKVIGDILGTFITDTREAKNLQRVAPGLESSVLPEEPETSEVSTPTESNE